MGACVDQLRHAGRVLETEINAWTDNPFVDADSGDILYGGNFHAEPVGMVADGIAVALAEIGGMAERRIAMLTDAHHSMLPAFLVKETGLDSGFMVAQVTAAALASENKSLAHPATVDFDSDHRQSRRLRQYGNIRRPPPFRYGGQCRDDHRD